VHLLWTCSGPFSLLCKHRLSLRITSAQRSTEREQLKTKEKQKEKKTLLRRGFVGWVVGLLGF
jgi:hypothetical protein